MACLKKVSKSTRKGATEKHSPYGQEITSMNLDDATAICCQEPREQNYSCSLGGRNGILSIPFQYHSNISPSWASESSCVADTAFLCIAVLCDAA